MSAFHILDGFKPYDRNLAVQGKRNHLTNTPAVYCLTSEETGEVYIGSTSNFPHRIASHYSKLGANEHTNRKLQDIYNADGGIQILVRPTATHQEAQTLEQCLVDEMLPTGQLCNVAVLDVTKPSLGVFIPISDAHKQAISNANKNKVMSSETKERISNVKKAFYQTEEGRKVADAVIAAKSIPITIDGKDYRSVREASRQIGVHPRTLAQYKPQPS